MKEMVSDQTFLWMKENRLKFYNVRYVVWGTNSSPETQQWKFQSNYSDAKKKFKINLTLMRIFFIIYVTNFTQDKKFTRIGKIFGKLILITSIIRNN